MANSGVPANGPYYVFVSGRGTAQTAILYHGSKPQSQNTYVSTSVFGPYSTLADAEKELSKVGFSKTTNIMVMDTASGNTLGQVDMATSKTSTSTKAPAGGGQASDPNAAVKAQGGTEGSVPSIPNPAAWFEDFLNAMTSASLWLRVGKVVIGGTLVIVAISHMTGVDNAVTKAVKHIPIIPV